MTSYWDPLRNKIDGMTLRERTLVFLAVVSVMILLMKAALLDPLLAKQKILTTQMSQQQEKMREFQAQMQLQGMQKAQRENELLLLRARLAQLKQQLQEQDDYLQSRQDRLVEPSRMADLLKQVLDKNDKLQLVELKTLPVSLLIEKAQANATDIAEQPVAPSVPAGQGDARIQKKIFKHGVQITVRGSYLDMLRYVTALERMPVRMFWGAASLKVDKYPDAVLTLTLYTLSLDKTWLTV